MLLTTFGIILLLTISAVNGDLWQLPTAADIQTSLETCQITNLLFLNGNGNQNTQSSSGNSSDIRCFAKQLGLWSDDEGFKAKRFAKFLNKHQQSIEILVVVDYCNNSHKQADLDKWANETFNCFAKGSMGPWIRDYIKTLYKKKLAN